MKVKIKAYFEFNIDYINFYQKERGILLGQNATDLGFKLITFKISKDPKLIQLHRMAVCLSLDTLRVCPMLHLILIRSSVPGQYKIPIFPATIMDLSLAKKCPHLPRNYTYALCCVNEGIKKVVI